MLWGLQVLLTSISLKALAGPLALLGLGSVAGYLVYKRATAPKTDASAQIAKGVETTTQTAIASAEPLYTTPEETTSFNTVASNPTVTESANSNTTPTVSNSPVIEDNSPIVNDIPQINDYVPPNPVVSSTPYYSGKGWLK